MEKKNECNFLSKRKSYYRKRKSYYRKKKNAHYQETKTGKKDTAIYIVFSNKDKQRNCPHENRFANMYIIVYVLVL